MTHLSSKITAHSLFIEPYSKGSLMMKEACQKQTSNQILCNRVVHFIVGASLLIPIVNTIVTLVMRCFCKAKESSATSATKPLENRASVSSETTQKINITKTQETKPSVTQPEASSKKPNAEKKEEKKRSLTCEATLGKFGKCPDVLINKINEYLRFKDMASFARTNKHIHSIAQKPLTTEKTEADTFLRAVDLMFHARTLKNHARRVKFSEEERVKRHQELLESIAKLNKKLVNHITHYRDGMMTRSTTLLIQAILEIENPERRLEVVKALLEKGADPRVHGVYYVEVDPLKDAEEKDPALKALLEKAIEKLKKEEAEEIQRVEKKNSLVARHGLICFSNKYDSIST